MNLYDLACQQLWAMREGDLRSLLDLLSRESLDPDLARQIREDRASRPSALAAKSGSKLDNTRAVAMRGSVAIMEVIGPIVRRADMFSEISGATDVGTLSRDFATATAASNVDAVLFVLDSPGGEVGGIAEFAAMIAQSTKPVWGYGESVLASAAYWLAAAMDRVVVDKTAIVGSIGIAMAVPDPTKQNRKELDIVSSQSPHKHPDPTTETGRGQLQAIVDATADEFVADVATYRNVSAETVLSDFGQGGVMVGKAAVTAGMVDALGSFESTLVDLQAAVAAQRQQSRDSLGAREEPMDWKAFWAPLLGEAAAAEGAPIAALINHQGSEAETQAQIMADNAALRKELAAARAAQIQTEAQTFAKEQIAAGRTYPVAQASLIALYALAAEDDAVAPRADGRTRVQALRAFVETQPANQLAKNLVQGAPLGGTVLPNAIGADDPFADDAASARAYAERANGNRKA